MSFAAKKTVLAFPLSLLLVGVFVVAPAFAQSPSPSSENYGLNKTAEEASLNVDRNLNEIIGGIVKTVLGITGVIFMLSIFGAGEIWLTAEGNEEKIEKARTTIFNSAIGVIIVFTAYIGTNFLINTILCTIGVTSCS
ncbi:hypothetical protein COV04_02130 [Candidatus Uhrbacteria bacterium CG10_big_fil_rev_8_21_14_0_10_48_11]|uniref:Uncharacterized protein n=1 Tax=Candidatus Uhrbacteria bacterium CG10_big_fil_rev_8_21_14_0_10_48_11 TaxID=1975037 RepID=A0A2M8LEP6_9BACT|nr:MAG: hypothetical protein COV04_02130 [Candidatus Uhrbacteria bacterium CG10_big_fil_rev_8_21_14_0_10_48_11]